MTRLTIRRLAAFAIFLPLIAQAATVTPQAGDRIKASGQAVYYYAANGKRYVFPTEKTYASWYPDFSAVKTVSDAELAAIPLGGNVTYRPGIRLIKVTTDPKVYAVDAGKSLRWIQTEQLAMWLYGAQWAQLVDDLPDTFFINYSVGAPIDDLQDHVPSAVRDAYPTIQTVLDGVSPAPAPAPAPVVQAANQAGAFRWGSWMDTSIDVSSFYAGDHTISLWFLPQYERSYEGPLLANVGSGTFLIEMGDHIDGGNKPNVVVKYGSAVGRYAIPDPVPYPSDVPDWLNTTVAPPRPTAKWRHITVVRTGNTVTVYLQGKRLCVDGLPGCVDLTVPAGASATGKLRIGKRVITASERETQFYGLIDEIVLWNRVLTQTEIAQISGAAHMPRLSEIEVGLVNGYTFDAGARGVLQQTPTINGTAYVTAVGDVRDGAEDAAYLPTPIQSGTLTLPFATGETWQVLQGFNSSGSHRGYAAFCWDLMHVPAGAPVGQPQVSSADTEGKDVRAARGGTLVEMRMAAPVTGASNMLIQHAANEFAGYLHMALGTAKVAVGAIVTADTPLASASNVGGGGPHLHFAVSNNPESKHDQLVTFPVAFSNYYASDDYGRTWAFVASGMPRIGQWIHR